MAAKDDRITLKVGGKEHDYRSLREATLAVREKQTEVLKTERAHLDAVIEFGQWLLELKPHVGHGKWEAHLQGAGIHVKRAQRAMRLAQEDGVLWPAKGTKNDQRSFLTKPGAAKDGRMPARPRSVHEAEIAAGMRKPAPKGEFVMEGYGSEGDSEFEKEDGEVIESSATERDWTEADEARETPVTRTPVKPATGPQLTLASIYAERIAPHIDAVINELGDAPSGVSIELLAEWRALRDKTAKAMRGGR